MIKLKREVIAKIYAGKTAAGADGDDDLPVCGKQVHEQDLMRYYEATREVGEFDFGS